MKIPVATVRITAEPDLADVIKRRPGVAELLLASLAEIAWFSLEEQGFVRGWLA